MNEYAIRSCNPYIPEVTVGPVHWQLCDDENCSQKLFPPYPRNGRCAPCSERRYRKAYSKKMGKCEATFDCHRNVARGKLCNKHDRERLAAIRHRRSFNLPAPAVQPRPIKLASMATYIHHFKCEPTTQTSVDEMDSSMNEESTVCSEEDDTSPIAKSSDHFEWRSDSMYIDSSIHVQTQYNLTLPPASKGQTIQSEEIDRPHFSFAHLGFS